MGLYKYCFKIRLGADETWNCSLVAGWDPAEAAAAPVVSGPSRLVFQLQDREDWTWQLRRWLHAAAVHCLSHADCFCLAVPAPSCRQICFGAQASVWVLLLLGVCLCTAMPIPGTDSLGCGVGAGGGQSPCCTRMVWIYLVLGAAA